MSSRLITQIGAVQTNRTAKGTPKAVAEYPYQKLLPFLLNQVETKTKKS